MNVFGVILKPTEDTSYNIAQRLCCCNWSGSASKHMRKSDKCRGISADWIRLPSRSTSVCNTAHTHIVSVLSTDYAALHMIVQVV